MKIKEIYEKVTSSWINIVFAVLGLVAMIILGLNIVKSFDIILILNKIYNAGLLLGIFTIYKIFFATRGFDNDAKISESPIALAIDSGFLAVAIAIVIGN